MTNYNTVRQKFIKSKISDFKANLAENWLVCPAREHLNLSAFENISPLEKVDLRGFCGNYHLALKVTEDDFQKSAQAQVGDNFINLKLKNNSSSTKILGVVKNYKSKEKIKLLTKFKTTLIDNKIIYEKIISGRINKNKVNLISQSRFLRWQGISQKNFSGTLNKKRIFIILNDLGKIDNHKTLIAGSIYQNSTTQTLNLIARWRKHYGHLHQIEGYLLPLLIYSQIKA